jgi:hypothetical protein
MDEGEHEGEVVAEDPPRPLRVDPLDRFGAKLTTSLSASFEVAIGNVGDMLSRKLDEQLREIRREAELLPVTAKLSSAFTYQTSGPVICQQNGFGQGVLVGGPTIGDQWSVRQIVVTGITLGSTVPGQAWILVSAAPPSELSPTSVIDWAQCLPSVAFYTPGQMYVQPNEKVYLVITGGTPGSVYVASFTFQVTKYTPAPPVHPVHAHHRQARRRIFSRIFG